MTQTPTRTTYTIDAVSDNKYYGRDPFRAVDVHLDGSDGSNFIVTLRAHEPRIEVWDVSKRVFVDDAPDVVGTALAFCFAEGIELP